MILGHPQPQHRLGVHSVQLQHMSYHADSIYHVLSYHVASYTV